MADDNMAGADRSHEALLIAFLRGEPGEPGDVARALVQMLTAGTMKNAADIVQAISSADLQRLNDIGHELGGEVSFPPTPDNLAVCSACFREMWLTSNLFLASFDEYYSDYIRITREALLGRSSYAAPRGIGAYLLENLTQFVEHDAFEWLASSHPELWRETHVYLTSGHWLDDWDGNLERRKELAGLMCEHSDADVREWGRGELREVLEQMTHGGGSP